MKASTALLFLVVLGCQKSLGGDEGPAPAASNIPRAAPNATGATYPPPTAYPPGLSPPGGGSTPPPQFHDPFGTPTPVGVGGGGTHL